MIGILEDTPIEEYQGIFVKREDLCAPPGAPPFSKIRGVVKHLEKLKKEGYKGVAYVETSISMAGWGLAWASAMLGMKCLIFNPVYKNPPALLLFHRAQWRRWGAELQDIPAGRAKVNYYAARKRIPKGYQLLPLGLPLPETLSETYSEARKCVENYRNIVMCVGSGTIAAGVFQATEPTQSLYGVMCRSGSMRRKTKHITGETLFSFITKGKLELIDERWEYAKPCLTPVPFPCHPYYDAKAWDWLIRNKDKIEPPVLFWNIGSTGDFDIKFGVGQKRHSEKRCRVEPLEY